VKAFALRELLKRKKTLIFDFDGTIADSSSLHKQAFETVLEPLGILVNYSEIAGMKTFDAILMLVNQSGKSYESDFIKFLVEAKQVAVRQLIRTELQAFPGACRFLEWVRRDHHCAMATSGSRETIELSLEKLGYSGWFNPLVCADDVSRAKPAPDIFLKVLASVGSEPRDALIFEDSKSGLEAATRAGIDAVTIDRKSWLEYVKLVDED
jgi:sugar-phosphatase